MPAQSSVRKLFCKFCRWFKQQHGHQSTTHFLNAGTYPVKLIAYNGTLKDTITINVKVNPKNQTYTFTGSGNWDIPTKWVNPHCS